MRRCKNCLMAETKPGIELDDDELCQACTHSDMREEVDYEARWAELEELVDAHRRDSYYDCIIPVSGGKDSHYQTLVMTERLDMNPLLVAVSDPFPKTEAGKHNIQNLTEAFDCDIITVEIGRERARRMMRIAFEEKGHPAWPIDLAIYNVPIQTGIKLDIPLIIYGENVDWQYGGWGIYDHDDEEEFSALPKVLNDAEDNDLSFWRDHGISDEALNLLTFPSTQEIQEAGLEPVYLGYFEKWDGYANYKTAKKRGFRTVTDEWEREGHAQQYDQIDSPAYLVNDFMKIPKYGYGRVTDIVGFWRRSEHFDLSIEEARDLIEDEDYQLDERTLDEFLEFMGYTDREFWNIVESHRNEELYPEPFMEMRGDIQPPNDFENFAD